MKQWLSLMALMLLTLAGSRARADETENAPVVVPAQVPMYVAPLSQQTQPSYVPQSVALSGPRVIRDWNEDRPVPFGYHAEQRTRKGLIIAGAVTFGAMWLLTALGASADESGSSTLLAVPVLGPFLQLGTGRDKDASSLLILDGTVQVAGAAMLLVGLTSTRTVLVRNDLGEVRLSPIVTKEGAGMGLVGRF